MAHDIRVHVIPTFHHDISYLRPCDEYLAGCYEIIHSALRIMEADEDYFFSIEQQFLWERYWNSFPEKRELLLTFVRQGRLTASPGLYAVPDVNMTDGESMFMQALVGKRWLADTLGMNPNVCLIADCWGHHAQLPQMMTQCGYDTYMFTRCMRPDVREIGENYLWQGIDGSVIRAHWLTDSYAGMRFPIKLPSVNADEQMWLGVDTRELKRQFEARDRLNGGDPVLLPNGGDMQMPQVSAPEALRLLNGSGSLPAMGFSSFEAYSRAVPWEDKPVVRGEFNTSFQGTFAANIKIKQYNARLVSRLLSLEGASVLLGRDADVSEIWKLLLKQQFHDIICGTLTDTALRECLMEYALAERMISLKERSLEIPGAAPAALNPLTFERTEIVEHSGKRVRVTMPAFSATPLSTGEPLAEANAPRELPCAFESMYYRAEIDDRGYIAVLAEAETGRDLVGIRSYSSQAPVAFGEVHMQLDNGDNWNVFEYPWSVCDKDQFLTNNYPDPYDRHHLNAFPNVGPHRPKVLEAKVISDTGEQLVIEQRCRIGFWIISADITTTVTFSRHEPLIRYCTRLTTNGKHTRFRVAFPSGVSDGRVIHEIPFGWSERGHSEYPAMGYMDYADAGAGLALLNIGQPGNCVDEDGILLLSLHRSVAMEYKTASGESFQENIPQEFHYAVMPHTGNDAQAQLARRAQAYRQPPLVLCAGEAVNAGISVNCEHVLVTAVRRDNDAVFVRLYEAKGEEGECALSVPTAFAAYAPADGLQNPTAAFTVCDGVVRLRLRAHEIVGLLFKRAGV